MKELNLLSTEGSCVQVALQYLSGKDDISVVEACIKQGMHDAEILKAAKELGIVLDKLHIQPQEVRTFLRNNQKGTFFVSTYDHVFVIENGRQVDPYIEKEGILGTRRIIRQAWRVID